MTTKPGAIRRRRAIALIGYGSFLLIGWTGVLVPSLIRSIEGAFRVQDADVGAFFFVFALSYAAGSFGGGLLTERLGRRVVLPTAAALLGLGLAGMAIASAWLAFVLAAVPAGFGAGAIDGGVNGLFMAIYPQTRGGALNLLHLFFALGSLLAPLLVGQLADAGVAWQAILLGSAAVGVAMAALLALQDLPSGRSTHHGVGVTPGDVLRDRRPRLPLLALAVAIGCYVASEVGVSSWLVRFLDAAPLAVATGALSAFWGGLTLGRLLSSRVADRLDPITFAGTCVLLASISLIAAVIAPVLPLAVSLFALAGFFFGPVYPMIMVIGGTLYPHRLAAVSGGLGAAAIVGSILYPPLMGLISVRVGIGFGMLGTGILGLASAGALVAAGAAAGRTIVRRSISPTTD